MIEVKVQRIGDELGVILPPDVVAQLHIGEGSPLRVLAGTGDAAADRKLELAIGIAERYRNTLRELAK